jgi:pimeloyl-ACP methyl ester carboxylesterase
VVTDELRLQGLTVNVVPNPLRGIASDSQYLKDYLAAIAGPIVLVGHSYGGMIITAAAAGNSHVTGLVYVNAYIPRDGDTIMELTASQPGSDLDPDRSINAVPIHDVSGGMVDVDVYIKPEQFGPLLVGDAAGATVAALAVNQRPLTLSSLSEPYRGTPAWVTIPSWAFVGVADRAIPPDVQAAMAERARSYVVKTIAPHLSMVSHPYAVADLIIEAARASRR